MVRTIIGAALASVSLIGACAAQAIETSGMTPEAVLLTLVEDFCGQALPATSDVADLAERTGVEVVSSEAGVSTFRLEGDGSRFDVAVEASSFEPLEDPSCSVTSRQLDYDLTARALSRKFDLSPVPGSAGASRSAAWTTVVAGLPVTVHLSERAAGAVVLLTSEPAIGSG